MLNRLSQVSAGSLELIAGVNDCFNCCLICVFLLVPRVLQSSLKKSTDLAPENLQESLDFQHRKFL